MKRIARFAEFRRALPIVAAVLLLIAIVLPMWRITLTAPQYPGRELLIQLYAYPRLEGDVREIQMLNHYVGFYYPDPVLVEPNFEVQERAIAVPEWSVGPLPFLIVAATGAFVALAPTERKLHLGLKAQLIGTVATFGGLFAIIQYRLHQAGHALDPDAPLRGVDSFTPPVFGPYEVANISGFAWLGAGGYLTTIAIGLMIVAFLLRDSKATIHDVPAIVSVLPGRTREWIKRRRSPAREDCETTLTDSDPPEPIDGDPPEPTDGDPPEPIDGDHS